MILSSYCFGECEREIPKWKGQHSIPYKVLFYYMSPHTEINGNFVLSASMKKRNNDALLPDISCSSTKLPFPSPVLSAECCLPSILLIKANREHQVFLSQYLWGSPTHISRFWNMLPSSFSYSLKEEVKLFLLEKQDDTLKRKKQCISISPWDKG